MTAGGDFHAAAKSAAPTSPKQAVDVLKVSQEKVERILTCLPAAPKRMLGVQAMLLASHMA